MNSGKPKKTDEFLGLIMRTCLASAGEDLPFLFFKRMVTKNYAYGWIVGEDDVMEASKGKSSSNLPSKPHSIFNGKEELFFNGILLSSFLPNLNASETMSHERSPIIGI
jgi:hypothetical protein